MKKSFSYNLTQFGGADNTVTEQIKTSDGVKTITTDANTGAVILSDQVDEDSLNPVTGAAVATAIAQGGGGVPEYGESDAGKVLQVDAQGDELVWAVAGGAYTAGNGIEINDGAIDVVVGSGGIQIATSDNALKIADEYGLVHVEDGAILVNHDDTIDETLDTDGHGCLRVSVPVPTVAYADTGKVLGVVDGPAATLGWVSAGGGGVPTPTAGDANKLLGVNYLGTGYNFVSRELPNHANVYNKVLHLDVNGDLGWGDFGSPLYMVDFKISNGSITCNIPEEYLYIYGKTFMWWIHMGRASGSGSIPFNNLSTLKVAGTSTEYEMNIGGIGMGRSANSWCALSLSGTGSLDAASGWYDRTVAFTFFDDNNNNITSSLASLQGLQGKFIYKFPITPNVP